MAETLESLAALERALTAPSSPSALTPEQVETRVERVIAQMARGAYAEAARASEVLLREGACDVRLVSPYLFGAFLTHGPRILPSLFSAVHQICSQGWERLGPDDNKPTLADSGLLWLFKSLHKHLEFHGRAQDDVWRRWCESCSRPHVQEALQSIDELVEILEQRLPGGGGVARLLQVTGWLRENHEAFPETLASPEPEDDEQVPEVENREEAEPAEQEEESPEEPPEKPEDEESKEEESREEDERQDEEDARLVTPSTSRTRAALPPEMEHSPALEQLLHKLAAFNQLVERQDFSRASMVASDVLHAIDHFDPLVYLPSLFSRFLTDLSAHAERIEPLMEGSRSSLSERALERLYRTDLEAFLNSASGAEDPS
ncbi:hypothetical protein HPC49_12455 [Pyxidicoccus fallax]|uniref:Uncharacterized protein n=1 Tax=Pyxidicoccus fallax TaxID=394095 RepID=A0A848LLQ1_9BACT|nr:type VI secretion system protein IglI family protein [Pyxidicoccus fallax]NMO18641.1 hypothetical protein [Pyxidicoccus fallax]NPC79046.1 hypothetical protein [Pyxidicoccus fallax]